MNHKEFLDFLKEERACPPAIRWVSRNGYDLDSAWNNCYKVTWMLWILNKINFDKRDMVELACNIAEEIVDHAGYDKEICDLTLRRARQYVRGFAKYHELHKCMNDLEKCMDMSGSKKWNILSSIKYAAIASAKHKQKANNCGFYVYESIERAHLAINNTIKILETKKTTKIQTSIIRSMIDSDDVLTAIEKYKTKKLVK
jgi:hypothetical protein